MQRVIQQGEHLFQPAQDATLFDVAVGQGLKDTLQVNRGIAVGLAANMIGHQKRIITFVDETDTIQVMYNPKILSSKQTYTAQESCLSLAGERTVMRYQRVNVTWQDAQFNRHEQVFTGYTAQIIQHEIDHTNGVLI
jgi:peptide deformylase